MNEDYLEEFEEDEELDEELDEIEEFEEDKEELKNDTMASKPVRIKSTKTEKISEKTKKTIFKLFIIGLALILFSSSFLYFCLIPLQDMKDNKQIKANIPQTINTASIDREFDEDYVIIRAVNPKEMVYIKITGELTEKTIYIKNEKSVGPLLCLDTNALTFEKKFNVNDEYSSLYNDVPSKLPLADKHKAYYQIFESTVDIYDTTKENNIVVYMNKNVK